MLLGDSGVTRLITRATFDHTDNRPRLEFVAARRFLDPGAAAHAVFDSLMQIGTRDDGTSPFALLRILALRRGDPGVLPYLEGARRAQPDVAEWSVRMAGIRLAMGDTARADSLLETVLAPGRHLRSDALVMRALLAAVRSRPLATVWLREALAAGGDTAQLRAALALIAARSQRWDEAAREARGALSAARGTFRHPFPGEFLSQALGQIAIDAPPALADSVLRYAVNRRPGSARYRELAAVAALRAGRCEDAAAGFVELLDFAMQRANGPALVRDCWAGQGFRGTGASSAGTAEPPEKGEPPPH
jgi:alkylhydroperoxidase/carboxymuconolactone decarboxylase family protein YurZ